MIRKLLPGLCGALLLVLALPTPAPAGGAKKKQANDVQCVGKQGRIDWTKGVLYATGLGAMSKREPNQAKAYLRARGFAKLDALRNLLMVVDHVRIDSHTVGADYETVSDEIKAEVQGIVRGAQVVSERTIPINGSTMIEVTVATAMYGDQGIANVFVPESARRADENRPDARDEEEPTPQPRRPEPEVEPAPITPPTLPNRDDNDNDAPDTDGIYTSVIIDTRGYHIERSMCPKILRQDGSEVWGTVKVDPNFVLDQGIVVYARSMEEARRIDRVGSRPLILHATARGGGRFPSDAILSDEDADRLLSANQHSRFLSKFKVIFVVDPAKPLPF
jgi:hypothetical protein